MSVPNVRPLLHRARFALLLALLVLAGFTPVAQAAAPAGARGPGAQAQGSSHAMGWYLALGDSLAAGYQPGRTPAVDLDGGYVRGVLDALRDDRGKTNLRNLACPGATTTTMVSGGGACTYDEGTQLAQALQFLHAHARHTRVVTLTVGANDVTPCLQQARPDVCAATRLQTVGANLATMLQALHAAAPDADIVVTNYYNPYLALYFDPVRQGLLPLTTQLQQLLNATIAGAAAGRADVADVATEFSSYDNSPVSGSNPVPTNVAVICAWTWMCVRGDIHANDLGYAAIARAVVARL